jgi:hypothetical protein
MRVLQDRIPLGPPPSLHPLRGRTTSPPFVRELRRYYGAVRLPGPCIGGVRLSASHRGPHRGRLRASRFSRMVLPRMLGVSAYDRARSHCTSPFLVHEYGLRLRKQPRHLGVELDFAAQCPGLRVPLSTLRARPCGRVHMTRGHRGWLALQCAIPSFAAPCRFIPALPAGRIGQDPALHNANQGMLAEATNGRQATTSRRPGPGRAAR